MTFTPPRIPPVFETNKVPNPNDANNPGFPIGCIQQEQNADGTSPNTPPFGDGDDPVVAPTIGTVTVTGLTNPTVGTETTYTADNDGTATNVTYVFTASTGENFSGGDVTFSAAGASVVTATATAQGASDDGAQGSLPVTVQAANVPLTLTITATGTTAAGGGDLTAGGQIGALYTINPGGTPETPAFQWAVAGTDSANVTQFRMMVQDQTAGSDGAGGTGLFTHWNIGGSGGGTAPATLFVTNTEIASTDAVTNANTWNPTTSVGQVSDGVGGFAAPQAFSNGWEPVGGFGTGQNESHTYRVTVGGFSAEGTLLVTGTFDFTHVE
jgi:hypothetical protein